MSSGLRCRILLRWKFRCSINDFGSGKHDFASSPLPFYYKPCCTPATFFFFQFSLSPSPRIATKSANTSGYHQPSHHHHFHKHSQLYHHLSRWQSQQSPFQVCRGSQDLNESRHHLETKLELSAVKDELQAIRKMLEAHNKWNKKTPVVEFIC